MLSSRQSFVLSPKLKIAILLLWVFFMFTGQVAAQTEPPDISEQVEAIFTQMTSAERVGQLFLVTFEGDTAAIDSDIAGLILQYHVGGVVLKAENENVIDVSQVRSLTQSLQRTALRDPQLAFSDELFEDEAFDPAALLALSNLSLPVFIAIQHEGDGAPNTQILDGLTAIPNEMALGATWNPDNADIVGRIAGRELSRNSK